jgi:RHH-type proline utilization regulon transcriptional repressor/proline dehydrogenase/delta 1-pyrroline-5-carboxylate dehydrogenase
MQRYRHHHAPIVVRIDPSFNSTDNKVLGAIQTMTGAKISFSTASDVLAVPDAKKESVDELMQRCTTFAKVRWLSKEVAPVGELLEFGISTDRRPLAQAGDVEGPRWLLEQSVAMTRHRYGNVNAGPKPTCKGLGDD